MTIYSVANGDRGTVKDADGVPVEKGILADTVTGECVVFATDGQGRIKADANGQPVVITVQRPAPLVYEDFRGKLRGNAAGPS